MNALEVQESLIRRYATKIFNPEGNISERDWETLESALHMSPSGYGLQPWKFFIIQDRETRKQLTEVSLNQTQIMECSHFVVFASKTSVDEAYIESHVSVVSNARKMPKESFSAYYQMMVDDVIYGPKSKYVSEWAARQAYIALGALVTSAAMLGIDSCPMEGIIPEKYDEILNLTGTGYRALAGCALGYRSPSDKYAYFNKARFEKDKVIQYV